MKMHWKRNGRAEKATTFAGVIQEAQGVRLPVLHPDHKIPKLMGWKGTFSMFWGETLRGCLVPVIFQYYFRQIVMWEAEEIKHVYMHILDSLWLLLFLQNTTYDCAWHHGCIRERFIIFVVGSLVYERSLCACTVFPWEKNRVRVWSEAGDT